MPLPYVEFDENPFLKAYGRREMDRSFRTAAGAMVEDPRVRPTESALAQKYLQPGAAEAEALQSGALGIPPLAVVPDPTLPPGSPIMQLDEIKTEFGHLGVEYKIPTPRHVVEAGAQNRRDDLHRQEILEAGPQGWAAEAGYFGAALGGGLVDPVNIASGMIPVGGEAILAGRGAGLVAQRIGGATAGGFVGSVAVEPLNMGLSRQQQLDYSMGDALRNVAIGTFIGTGLGTIHAGIGAAVGPDAKSVAAGTPEVAPPSLVPDAVRAASPGARQGAFKGALAQVMNGDDVNVVPVFEIDKSLREASEAKAPARVFDDGTVGNPTPLTKDERAAVLTKHKSDIEAMVKPAKEAPAPEIAEPIKEFDEAYLDTVLSEIEDATQEFHAKAPEAASVETQAAEARRVLTRGPSQDSQAARARAVEEPSLEGLPEDFAAPPDFHDDVAFSLRQERAEVTNTPTFKMGAERITPAQAREDLSMAAAAIIQRLPEDVAVRLTKAQPKSLKGTGMFVEGGYEAQTKMLYLTSRALDPLGTLRHEEIHVLRDLGLFTEKEWGVLSERADALRGELKIDETYRDWYSRRWQGDELEGRLREEAVARMVESYQNGARFGTDVDTILQAIVDLFARLRNAARRLGFQNADDIIARIEAGEIGRRPQGEAGQGAMASLKRADEDVQKAIDLEPAIKQAARCMTLRGLV